MTKGGFAGGYAIVHVDWIGNDNADIYLRLVKADGTVVGPKLINDGTLKNGSQRIASVTELPDGRISIVWTDSSSSSGAIRTQIVDAREEVVTVEGTFHNDIYVGTNLTNAGDTLRGNGGDDTLFGGAGDDFLNGGIGKDSFDGGAGFDIVSYFGAAEGVKANLATPSDNTNSAVGDRYTNVEGLRGSDFADILMGNGGNNSLEGSAGDDELYGGLGADTFLGGTGTDTVTYAHAAAAVVVNLQDRSKNQGADAAGDVYADHVEVLIGSIWNDVLHGYSSTVPGAENNDSIYGARGYDSVVGGLGDGYLNGGQENDTLNGGFGLDTLGGFDGFDFVSYENAQTGIETSLFSDHRTGEAVGDTYIRIEGLIGSAHADIFQGNSTNDELLGMGGDDQLRGEGGVDTLEGGLGNDTLDGGAANLGEIDFAS